jgi:hypothetical protein
MSTEAIPARQTTTVLPRDLSDFVIELSIALHKHGMYPDGHPSLNEARAAVVRRLDALLLERQSLALGVARKQLIIEGLATDSRNPLLHGLAQQLHRHGVGAVKFLAGVRADEIEAVLNVLSADADRGAAAFQSGDSGERHRWEHVWLLPLTYDQLQLVNSPDSSSPTTPNEQRTSQLWLDLARAALQAEASADDTLIDPEVVAGAINAHAREQAYDQVIIGYLLQIAGELSNGTELESGVLRKHMSELVGALEPDQLRQLLELGGDITQRGRFLLDASRWLTVDAALALLEAAASASHQVISESLMRLFTKLAIHADRGVPAVRPEAESALRDQIQTLVSGWTLPDPSSQRYGAMLEHMSLERPLFMVPDDSLYRCEQERMVQMSLEVGCAGALVDEAVDAMLARGELATLVDLLGRASEESEAATAIKRRVATVKNLQRLLDDGSPESREAKWIVQQLGLEAAEPLLEALATADTRARRRLLLDQLRPLAPLVADVIVARLSGAPWYLQRNLLVLLEGLPALPGGFAIAPYAVHEDVRVRRQAFRLLIKLPAERDSAICAALRDGDDQIVRLALGTALEQCPRGALQIIVQRLTARDFDAELELLAVRVVGSVREPAAIDCLLDYVGKSRGWFRVRLLARRSPRLLAALAGLAANWADEPRVAVILKRASRHPDPAIRAAVSAAVAQENCGA